MKKQIITLVTALMVAAIGAQAQSRLEPMTQTQQKLWGEKYFGTWLSERAIQQMLIFPSFSVCVLRLWGKRTVTGEVVRGEGGKAG